MGTAVGPAAAAALGFGACLLGFSDFLPIGHCLPLRTACLLLVRCDSVEAVRGYKALRVYGACNVAATPRELDGAMSETNVHVRRPSGAAWQEDAAAESIDSSLVSLQPLERRFWRAVEQAEVSTDPHRSRAETYFQKKNTPGDRVA